MANAERGEVELAFDKERYTLRMSINAVAEVETYLDLGVDEIAVMIRDPSKFRIGTWRVLLWGALREFHDVSIEEAGEIMGRAGVGPVVEKVGEALRAAFPEAKEPVKGNPPNASHAAGRNTSGTGSSKPAVAAKTSGRALRSK